MIETELLNEGDNGGLSAWPATILAGLNSVVVDCLVYSIFQFQAKDKIEVSLIQVDDPKVVDFIVTLLFEDHHADDVFPATKQIVLMRVYIIFILPRTTGHVPVVWVRLVAYTKLRHPH